MTGGTQGRIKEQARARSHKVANAMLRVWILFFIQQERVGDYM